MQMHAYGNNVTHNVVKHTFAHPNFLVRTTRFIVVKELEDKTYFSNVKLRITN